jgi:hypothetical protein
MAAIYSNGGNRWNILGFNFTKRDALSSVYNISMDETNSKNRYAKRTCICAILILHHAGRGNGEKVMVLNGRGCIIIM